MVNNFHWICHKRQEPACVFRSPLEEILRALLIPPLFSSGATETASVIKALLGLGPIGRPGPPAKSSKLLSASETREMAMPMGAARVKDTHSQTKHSSQGCKPYKQPHTANHPTRRYIKSSQLIRNFYS